MIASEDDFGGSAAHGRVFTTRRMNATAAAWASSPMSRAAAPTRSSPRACRSSPISTIAAASAPIRSLGDGAGCLIQIPDALFRAWAEAERLSLPPAGDYAVAMCFLPRDEASRAAAVERFERFVRIEGQIAGRLARRAGRHDGHRRRGARDDAGDPPGGDRARAQCEGPGRVRAQVARDPQADPEPAGARGAGARPAGPRRFLHRLASRAGPSSTRACCSPTRSAASTRTSPIR